MTGESLLPRLNSKTNMRIKPEKWMKRAAAGIFLVALVLNVKITLDGPYFLVGHELVAQTTGTGTNTGTGTTTSTSTSTGTGDQGRPTCAAGGCNATSCSYSGTIEVMGNSIQVSNSVSCEGTWACCHITAFCFDKKRCS